MDNYNSISQSPRIKFDTIQVFRFIAALMVIIYHATVYASQRLAPGIKKYEEGGYNAVSLFFVISGFVMIISSESLIKKASGWRIFAVKRIVRVVPIYWILTTFKLIVLIVGASLVVNNDQLDLAFILKSYFFIAAKNSYGKFFPIYNVGWTLNYEMFFYLLFTLALAIKVRPIAFLSVIFIVLAGFSFCRTPQWPEVSFYFDTIVLNFLYGMLVARLILDGKKLPRTLSIMVVIAGLLYLFFPREDPTATGLLNSKVIVHLCTFLIIYGGASIEAKLGDRLPNFLVYLGGASYSLYLIHPSAAPLASTVLNKLGLHLGWLAVVLGVVFSLMAGVIFYQLCEKPLTRKLSALVAKWKLI